MLTTDLALRFDPVYEPISRRFLENPDEFADAFARAWFKLTHRDMGPIARYLGPEVPHGGAALAGPGARGRPRAGRRRRRRRAQGADPRLGPDGLAAGLDRVGVGVDVPRQRQARRRQRRPHPPRAAERLGGQRPRRSSRTVLRTLEGIQESFNAAGGGKQVSLADLIVLGGARGGRAGRQGRRPRRRGAVHARAAPTPSQEQTDVESFAALEPTADGFRNYLRQGPPAAGRVPAGRPGEPADPERARDDRPRRRPARARRQLRAARRSASSPTTPGPLTNDFFVNLLDLGTTWTADVRRRGDLRGPRRATGEVKWTGSRVDLVFGSNSELRALAEVYASDDAQEKFVRDFVAAWAKVMDLDRFDVRTS